ncbi:hypothetical protein RI056_01435 [Komagataeibacter nataicola]|uniref:hypothetical protein n=1 Tax=Komagataeibacter nataicola TaxID=265960 RepID=UPI0028AA7B8D|nr:hypothetical protein [Komagataeibacter nataicola]WNM08817.1 hypothetical protein RI056_01435 [Komagataeibacter nataicola]
MSEALRHLENGEPDLSPSTGVDDISSRWRLMHRAGESSFSYRHPVVSQVVVLSDAMCVCLAVVACIAWQRIYDTPELSGALLLANVMAGGAFFLFPKNVPLLDIPDITRLSFQLRYLAPRCVWPGRVLRHSGHAVLAGGCCGADGRRMAGLCCCGAGG